MSFYAVKKSTFRVIAVILGTALLMGCSTAVTFNSNRPQNVIVNGKPIGVTPVTTSLSNAVWNDYSVVYEDVETGQVTTFTANKEVKAGGIVAGIFFWLPFLWCYGPEGNQYQNVMIDESAYYYDEPSMADQDAEYQEYLRQKAEADAAAEEEAQRREYEEFLEYKRMKEGK